MIEAPREKLRSFDALDSLLRYLKVSILALGFFFVAMTLIAMVMRLFYPYPLDWLEEDALDTVFRLANGQALYQAPGPEHVAWVYAPVYDYVSLPMFKLLGPGYLPLRLTSALAFAGCCLLLFMWLYRRFRSPFIAVIPIIMLASTYRLTAYYFDLAHVDMLAYLGMLLGAYLLTGHRQKLDIVLSALFFTLACFTKQNIALPTLIVGSWLLLTERRTGILFAACVGLFGAALLGVFMVQSHGWFAFYAMRIVGGHGVGSYFQAYASTIRNFPLWSLLALSWFLLPLLKIDSKTVPRREVLLDSVLILSFILMALSGFAKKGGSINNYIPLFIAGGLVAANLVGVAMEYQSHLNGRRILLLLLLAIGMQMASTVNNFLHAYPNVAEREAWASIHRLVRDLRGPGWLVTNPATGRQENKTVYLSWESYIWAVKGAQKPGLAKEMNRCRQEMHDLATQKLAWIATFEPEVLTEFNLVGYYTKVDSIPQPNLGGYSVSDSTLFPFYVYLRTDLLDSVHLYLPHDLGHAKPQGIADLKP